MDNLTHTINRQQANIRAREENGQVTFDPSITADGDLSQNFWIFTDTTARCHDPAYRKQPPIFLQEETVTVYAAGSCLNAGNVEAQTGGGVWYGPNHPDNKALRIPGENQSSQIGALAAILHAIQNTPPFAPLHIISNSKYVVKGLTVHLPRWEQSGWIGIANENFLKPII